MTVLLELIHHSQAGSLTTYNTIAPYLTSSLYSTIIFAPFLTSRFSYDITVSTVTVATTRSLTDISLMKSYSIGIITVVISLTDRSLMKLYSIGIITVVISLTNISLKKLGMVAPNRL
jgi:hypothetical protein